jgi:hypothetical protein
MHLRLILQPTVAMLLAARDGYRDAVSGRTPYLQDIVHNPAGRSERLKEGYHVVARVMLMCAVMEGAYQLVVMKALRPIELATVVLLLAVVPYLVMRGPVRRIISRILRHSRSAGPEHRSRTF